MVGPHQNAAGILDLAHPGPVAMMIDEGAARANDVADKADAQIGSNSFGSRNPSLATQTGQQGKAAMTAKVERGRFGPSFAVVNPCMGQAGTGPGGGLIMQVRIQLEGRFNLPVGENGVGPIALVHFNAMRVELVFLEGDGFANGLALCFGGGGAIAFATLWMVF